MDIEYMQLHSFLVIRFKKGNPRFMNETISSMGKFIEENSPGFAIG